MSTTTEHLLSLLTPEQRLFFSILSQQEHLAEDLKELKSTLDQHEQSITEILNQITEPPMAATVATTATNAVTKLGPKVVQVPTKRKYKRDGEAYAGHTYTTTVREVLPEIRKLIPVGYKKAITVKKALWHYDRLGSPEKIPITESTMQSALGYLVYTGDVHRVRRQGAFVYWIPADL